MTHPPKIAPKFIDAKILLIDDEMNNLKVLKRMLTSAGFKSIQVAENGEKGIELFDQSPPDIMLLDIRMQGLNGFEVLRQIRKRLPRDTYFPIIILSAQQDAETRLEALGGGARDFISKPFDLMEIVARINNLLEIHYLEKAILEQNRSLEQRVQERKEELNKTRQEVLDRLGRASEYRDNETGMHVLRIGNFAEILAREIGLSERESLLISQASPLHDIGKIGIPDQILLKPEKLDAQEWEIMKRHCEIGAEILSGSNSELLNTAEVIALNHHEQWGGGGYPNGLKGESIPLEARIVGLCDVFDALTSKRPHKKPWSAEKAIQQMESQGEEWFDPYLFEALKHCLPRMKEIVRDYTDSGETYLQQVG